MTQKDNSEIYKKNRGAKSIRRTITRIIGAIILLIIFAGVFLNYSLNQQWGTKKIESYLSSILKTPVHIDTFHLNILRGLSLQGFYIEDYKKDTLIYLKRVDLRLEKIPFSLFFDELYFDEINIQKARLHINTYEGDSISNLQYWLGSFKSNRDTNSIIEEQKRLIHTNIKNIFLDEFTLTKSDENNRVASKYSIAKLDAKVDVFDVSSNYFKMDYVHIHHPVVTMDKYPVLVQNASNIISNNDSNNEPQISSSGDNIVNINQASAFHLLINQLEIEQGDVEFNNYRVTDSRHVLHDNIDYNHIMVHDINVVSTDFEMQGLKFAASVPHMSFREESGFVVNSMCIGEGSLSGTSLELKDTYIYTPNSVVGDYFKLSYANYTAYLAFVDDIFIKTNMNHSHLGIRDVMHFVPALKKQYFFNKNIDEYLEMDGKIFGLINNLKARNIQLQLNKQLSFEGNIDIRNATNRGQELFNIRAKKLSSNILSLNSLFTSQPVSNNLNRLGKISFKGQFDGFIEDFVFFGEMKSDLGIAKMDMKLNTRPGLKDAQYDGTLQLIDFDLGQYLNNSNIGIINFTSSVKKGHGLTFETAQANLNAHVTEFLYNGYLYKDLLFDGALNKDLIDGKASIHDENIDLNFEGIIKNINTLPYFDFVAKIDVLRPKELNFTNREFTFSGLLEVAFEGLDPDIVEGSMTINEMEIRNSEERFYLERAHISQHSLNPQIRTLIIESTLLDANISGNYLLTKLHRDFIGLLQKTHGNLSKLFNLPQYPIDTVHRYYTLTVDIKKTINMLNILSGKKIDINDVGLTGYFYGGLDSMGLQINTPQFSFNEFHFNQLNIDISNGPNSGRFNISGSDFSINQQTILSNYNLSNMVVKDSIKSHLSVENNAFNFETFDLNLLFYAIPSLQGFGLKFLPSEIYENKQKWVFNPANNLFYSKNNLDIREFSIIADDRQIIMDNVGNKGLDIWVNNIEFDLLDSVLNVPILDFSGKMSAKLRIGDVFNTRDFSGQITSGSLNISDIPLGQLIVDYQLKDFNSPLKFWLNTSLDEQRLKSQGQVLIGAIHNPKRDFTQYRMNASIQNYPLKALEIIIPEGISNTQGLVSGELKLTGADAKPILTGELLLNQGQTTIDYLGTTYFFDGQKIKLKKGLWDFTNATLTDRLGNIATITGGIKQNYLKQFAISAQIKSPKIIALNTTVEQNPDYYGFALGQVEVEFEGPFKAVDIYVNAVTGKGSKLAIPVSDESTEQSRNNFIYFANNEAKDDNIAEQDIGNSGVNFVLDLKIEDGANTSIIFDEDAGDILEGYGSGNIHLTVDRASNISMYGIYNVVRGNYLFTLFNIVNKPFVVRPGGTIRWNGNPLDAQLDIEAVYEGLSAPVAPLIQQYIVNENDETKKQAQKLENIELEMKITGQLFSPTIDFDIVFPDITGKLRSYVAAEMSTIQQNQALLNQQVFGLIVLGGFMPNTGINRQSFSVPGLTSSISEYLSHQLSVLVTGVLQNALKDINFVSGASFNLDYNQINSILGAQQTTILDGEVNFEVKTRLVGDKIEVTYKGAFSNSSVLGDPYYNNTVIVELLKTSINGLRVRLNYEEDIYFNGPRQRLGIGTTFRKEFNSFKRKKKAQTVKTN